MTTNGKREQILVIVNDLDVAHRIVTECFALGYEPLVARDGFTGLLLAKRVKPRLILADLAIPGLDGFEIVRRVREMHELDGTAVVAITRTIPGRPAANQPAFTDFVLSPINKTRLDHVLSHFCECSELEAFA